MAHAQSEGSGAPTIELEWSGPGPERQCLGGAALARAVNSYLHREAITSPPAEFALSVRVEERPGHQWLAMIYLRDQRENRVVGERELVGNGPLCSSLDEPLKLAVALLVDEDLVAPSAESAPQRERAAAPTQPSAANSEADDDTDESISALPTGIPEFDTAPPHRPRLGLDLAALASYAALPEIGIGAELGVHWLPLRWLALRIQGVAFMPQKVRLAEDAEIRTRLWYAGALVCPRAALSEGVHLLGCGGLKAGALAIRSHGLEAGLRTQRPVWFASAEARVEWQLHEQWAVFGELGLAWPLLRQRFWYEDAGKRQEFHELSAPASAVGVGITAWLR